MAMLPRHMSSDEMWHLTNDEITGKAIYVNVLTRERVYDRKKYTGEGIQKEKMLHMFQTNGTMAYKKRKIWLSICKVRFFALKSHRI